MDIKYIYVIVGSDMKKDDVVRELAEEEYGKHGYRFMFNSDVETITDIIRVLKLADEIWIFGDVYGFPDYDMAREMGCDVWKMA